MKGLTMNAASKGLEENPLELIKIIIQNNPQGVAESLQSNYGVYVPATNWQDIYDEVIALMQDNPSNAETVLMEVLSVDIEEKNLTPFGQELVLNKLIESDGITKNKEEFNGFYGIAKSGGGPITSDDDLGQGAEVTGTFNTTGETDWDEVNQPTNNTSNFNWGPILQGAASGILAALFPPSNGSGSNNNNNGSNNNNTPPSDNTWIWILVIVILIAIALYIAFKK